MIAFASPGVPVPVRSVRDQIWELDSTSEGGFQIRNIHSQKCLVVQGLQDGNGAIQATCDSRFADQRWKL